MGYIYSNSKEYIDFLNKGNEIMIPIDYIKCIKLKREEFYDWYNKQSPWNLSAITLALGK